MAGSAAGYDFDVNSRNPDQSLVAFARIENRISLIEEQIRPLVDRAQFSRPSASATYTGAAGSYSTGGFFGEVPDTDGCFAAEALTADKRPLSLYQIQPSADGRSASVTLCDNIDMHQRALSNHKRLLLPVCHYVDLPQHSHTQVLVTEPGSAERIDGGWRIKDKISVRFA